jgi:hypothetical protein
MTRNASVREAGDGAEFATNAVELYMKAWVRRQFRNHTLRVSVHFAPTFPPIRVRKATRRGRRRR